MNQLESNFKPPEQEVKKLKKLTREEVISKLERGEDLENLSLTDLNLAGLNLEGKSFRGSDIRGLSLYAKAQSEGTNIKNADFTDTTIADLGPEALFQEVEAEGAKFGYTEDLISRKKRLKESGQAPRAEDTGGLFGFNGLRGNFRKTKWTNIDFGGGSGYEAYFPEADLSQSIIAGSDLSGIDFSETNIDSIKIIDPLSLRGLKINEKQIESVAQAIELSNQKAQSEFLQATNKEGPKKALKDYFGIIIVETKN